MSQTHGDDGTSSPNSHHSSLNAPGSREAEDRVEALWLTGSRLPVQRISGHAGSLHIIRLFFHDPVQKADCDRILEAIKLSDKPDDFLGFRCIQTHLEVSRILDLHFWHPVNNVHRDAVIEVMSMSLKSSPSTEQESQTLRILYKNWRAEVSERRITPLRVWFGETAWHPKPQWLLTAFDHDKQANRDFALKDFGGQPLDGSQNSMNWEKTGEKVFEAAVDGRRYTVSKIPNGSTWRLEWADGGVFGFATSGEAMLAAEERVSAQREMNAIQSRSSP